MASSTHGSSAHDIKEKATSQFEKMADRATDQFKQAADQAEAVASRVAEQGREVAGSLKGAVDRSVKEQPVTTLAVVAALGFVLGALWKS